MFGSTGLGADDDGGVDIAMASFSAKSGVKYVEFGELPKSVDPRDGVASPLTELSPRTRRAAKLRP